MVTNGCSVSHPYSLLYASTQSIWIILSAILLKIGLEKLFQFVPRNHILWLTLAYKICISTVDTATVARNNHRHRLARQLCTIIEKVRLHDSRHLVPPKRSYDDDVLVVAEIDVHRVDSGITARVVGICLDGIQQLRTQGVAVCLVLQSLLSRFLVSGCKVTTIS